MTHFSCNLLNGGTLKKNKLVATALAAAILVSGGGFTAIGVAPAYASNEQPKAIVPTITTTAESFELKWTPNSDENVVYYQTIAYDPKGNLVQITQDREPSFSAAFLTPNTTYTVEQMTLTRANDGSGSNYRSPTTTFTVTTKNGVVTPPYVPAPAKAPLAPRFLSRDSVAYNQASISWWEPEKLFGQVKNYTVTLKQAGKADRVFTVAPQFETKFKIPGLAENTAYTAHVRANVTAWEQGGKPATSPTASISIKTPYHPSRVVAKAPTSLTVGKLTGDDSFFYWRGFDVSWKAPTGIIGKVKNYTVTIKQGSKVVRTFTTTKTKESSRILSPSTSYTVQVKANIVSADGKKTASASTGILGYKTAAEPTSNVTLTTPKITFSKVGSYRFYTHWGATSNGKVTAYVTRWYDPNGKQVAYGEGVAKGSLVAGFKPSTRYKVVVMAIAISPNGEKTLRKTGTGYVTTASANAVKVSNPYALKAPSTTNSIDASWSWTDYFIGKQPTYTVTLKQGSKTIKTVTTSQINYKFTGLKSKTAYTVYVKSNGVSLDGKRKVSTNAISLTTTTK